MEDLSDEDLEQAIRKAKYDIKRAELRLSDTESRIVDLDETLRELLVERAKRLIRRLKDEV